MSQPAESRQSITTRCLQVALGAALAAVLVTSCSTVSSWAGLIEDLEDQGFTDVNVTVDTSDDPFVLVIRANGPAGDSTKQAQKGAAEVAWTTYPSRFEQLRVSIDGKEQEYTRSELTDLFGKRPAGLDEGSLQDDITRDSIGILVAVLVFGLVVVLAASVTALVILRSRRRHARQRRAWPDTVGPPMPWAPHDPVASTAPPGPWVPPGAPPAEDAPPPSFTPTPPPGGWTPAEPPVPPHAPEPPSSGELAEEQTWPVPDSDSDRKADVRLHGRRFRGPKPPATHLPTGWDN